MTDLIALEYGKQIIQEIEKADKIVEQELFPYLGQISTHRFDDLEFKHLAGAALVAAVLRKVKSIFYGEAIPEDGEPTQNLFAQTLRRLTSVFTERTQKQAEKTFTEEYKRQTGVEPPPIDVKEFVNEATKKNVSLIKTVHSRHFEKIQRLTEENVAKGLLTKDFEQKLSDLSELSKNQARLIARDQVSKLTATLNEARQRRLGVETYVWLTSQDSRVRSLSNSNGHSDHERLNGTEQSWNDPPVTVFRGKRAGERNHPGGDIACRCWAQPVYEELSTERE